MSISKKEYNAFSSKLIIVVTVLFLIGAQLPASAGEMNGEVGGNAIFGTRDVDIVVLGLVASVMDIVTIGVGAVSATGNLTYVARGKRATKSWLTLGYISGALNLAIGGIIMFSSKDDCDYFTLGAIQAGLGAAAFGITVWSHVLDDGTEQSLSLSPLVLPDNKGHAALGVGLKIAGW